MNSFQFDVFKVVGGTSGRANGRKVVQSIYETIISRDFLSSITWTGRAAKGKPKKERFEAFQHIIGFISELCILADKSLDNQKVEELLKYKVIKYAYLRTEER